jgi:putative ABC transport system permease protein
MNWRRYVRAHLPSLDLAAEREAEIVEELAQQLEAAYDGARARGASEAEAQGLAESEIADWAGFASAVSRIERPVATRLPQSLRSSASAPPMATTRGGLMSGFIQDVRYAIRALVRAPGFAAVAITTLALGIGATTIVYSLVDGILLRPLPIHEPDRVLLARELGSDGVEFSLAWPNFVDWKARARSFSNLAAWSGLPTNLTGVDQPRRLMARQITWNLLDVLGVQPVLGRGLTEADDQPGAERVCLVSYGFWQRELGGTASALGRVLTLDERPYVVVGVLPRDFTIARQEDIFRPLGGFLQPGSSLLGRGNHNGLAAIGRLAPGATVESARAELAGIAANLAKEYPETNSGQSAAARPLFEVLVSDSRPMLAVLLGAVLAMLLIACVNLANLLLARSSGRAQEIAVRRALGAAGWRIGRQLLTESMFLGLIGGVAGALLAWAGFSAVLRLLPSDQPRIHIVALDSRVLLFAAGTSIFTGVLFGLLPAWQAATGSSLSLLRSGRVTGAATPRARTRQMLVLAEVALALVLLAGAGLMVRTMANLLWIDPGFQPSGVISAQMSLPNARYTRDQTRAFYGAAIDRLKGVPGVVSAAFTNSLPVQGSNWNSVFIVSDQPVPARADLPSTAFTTVTSEYHETMGIRLLKGRLLLPSDGPNGTTVAVVNETFAKQFWPTGEAIGQRIKQGWPESQTPWREIVGIVRDVKTSGVSLDPGLQVYLPINQVPSTSVAVVVRTRLAPASMRSALEAALHSVDPNLPVYDIRTMDEVIGRGVGRERLTMVLLLGFAALALTMAAVGVFGVTTYTVSQRTYELGIRMALGADRLTVLGLVLRQELSACAIGIVVGLVGAVALSTVLQSLLYGVAPRDPATLATAAAVMIIVTFAAGYFPARRATRIDPVRAMRME